MPDRSQLAVRLIAPAGLVRALGLLLPALLAVRLPAALDGQDSVNFALGLLDFDPTLEQPHFPGYPVYIALCRLFAWTGLPAAVALSLPGVLAGAALIPAQSAVGRRFSLPPRDLALAALLLAVQPLVHFEGPRPTPDLLATVCVWSALALVACQRPLVGAALLGLALGVRPDLVPIAFVVFALQRREQVHFVSGLLLGIGLWLPLFALALPPDAVARAARFALGHFSAWGSSALAGAGGNEAARGLAFGLGAPILLALAVLGATRAPAPLGRFLAHALGPYLLWVLVGQNLSSPRHFLPLAPALAILAACAFPALERRRLRASGCGAVALSALALASFARPLHPNGRELSERVQSACRDCAAIFAGPSERLLQFYGPQGALLYRRAELRDVRSDLLAWPDLVGVVGITSEIAGSAGLGAESERVADGLHLYRIDAAALRLAP